MRPLSLAFFERVALSPERSLLRLSGRVDPALADGAEPALLVDDGRGAATRHAADQTADRFDAATGVFGLELTLPTSALPTGAAFALAVGGELHDLPAPRVREDTADAARGLAPAVRRLHDLERRLRAAEAERDEAARAAATARTAAAESERARTTAERTAEEAQARLQEVRERADRADALIAATQERAARALEDLRTRHAAELQGVRDEAERAIAELRASTRGDVEAARADAAERISEAMRTMAEAEQRAEARAAAAREEVERELTDERGRREEAERAAREQGDALADARRAAHEAAGKHEAAVAERAALEAELDLARHEMTRLAERLDAQQQGASERESSLRSQLEERTADLDRLRDAAESARVAEAQASARAEARADEVAALQAELGLAREHSERQVGELRKLERKRVTVEQELQRLGDIAEQNADLAAARDTAAAQRDALQSQLSAVTAMVADGMARSEALEQAVLRLRGAVGLHARDHLRAAEDARALGLVRERVAAGLAEADDAERRAQELRDLVSRRLQQSGGSES